jgi:polar amino acid transport system substrate-binding protein
MRRSLALLLPGALVAVLAGCTGTHAPAPVDSPVPFAVRPAGVEDPAVIPSTSAGPAQTCDPRASLRPPASMPAPRAMPPGSTMEHIYQQGRLVVGVDQNTYLFGYRDPASGQIVGFDIDIAREIARAIFGDPDKVQLTSITAAQRIPFIRGQGGHVDLVADTMTINCARLQQVNFSTDYFDAGQKILVTRGSPVHGRADLGGKRVCAAAGSTSIQNIAALPGHPVAVAVNDWTDCMVMLQQGQVDAVSTDDTILIGLARQDPHTVVVGDRFTDEPYGLAVAKTAPDFVRFVNGVLDRMRADGTWTRIYTRWLGAPVPAPPAARYLD